MKTKQYLLYVVLTINFSFFISCQKDENFTPETETINQDVTSLIPDGYSAKKLDASSDLKANSSVFHYVESGTIESELAQIKKAVEVGANLIIEVSNKQQNELLKDTIGVTPEVEDNMGKSYIIFYFDNERGRVFSFYSEKNKIVSIENLIEEDEVSVSKDSVSAKSKYKTKSISQSKSGSNVVTLSLGDIKNRIQENFSKSLSKRKALSKKNDSGAKKNADMTIEKDMYFPNEFRYRVIIKIAKGKPSNSQRTGYGVHVEYIPENGILSKPAYIGSKEYFGGNGCKKYRQTLQDMIAGITFKTTLTNHIGNGIIDGVVKDYYPKQDISENVSLTRESESYSFNIGSKVEGDVVGGKLGFDLSGNYTYNSPKSSSRIDTKTIDFRAQYKPGKFGITYFQNKLHGQSWVDRPLFYPLREGTRFIFYDYKFVKDLSWYDSETDSHMFKLHNEDLPYMSKGNTAPEHMVNFFVSDEVANRNKYIRIDVGVFLDKVNLYAFQSPPFYSGRLACAASGLELSIKEKRDSAYVFFKWVDYFNENNPGNKN